MGVIVDELLKGNLYRGLDLWNHSIDPKKFPTEYRDYSSRFRHELKQGVSWDDKTLSMKRTRGGRLTVRELRLYTLL